MKKIGPEFKILSPGAEKALIPIWIQVAERLKLEGSEFDKILWTTDFVSSVLAVRLTSPENEELAPKNDLLYATPAIADAMKVMEKIYGDHFCDETLRPFRSVYEAWIDYLILLAFTAPPVKKAFKPVLSAEPSFEVIASSVDEGLSGELRVLWPIRALKKTKLSGAKAKRERRSE